MEVVAANWVHHQQCHGDKLSSTTRKQRWFEVNGSIPKIQILGATAFDNVLASEQTVGTFFLTVGDYPKLLGATMEGITGGVWDTPQALDGWAESSGGNTQKVAPKNILA